MLKSQQDAKKEAREKERDKKDGERNVILGEIADKLPAVAIAGD